jgi:hypothetical protein
MHMHAAAPCRTRDGVRPARSQACSIRAAAVGVVADALSRAGCGGGLRRWPGGGVVERVWRGTDGPADRACSHRQAPGKHLASALSSSPRASRLASTAAVDACL